MADQYIEIPLETDPGLLVQQAYDAIEAVYPDYVPEAADPLTIDLEESADMIAEAMDVATRVARSIFRYFGANLVGIPPIDAVAALGNTTWEVIDDAGYTIPQGTNVAVQGPGGSNDNIGFLTTTDVVIPPGATSTQPGEVLIMAIDEGAAGTDLTGIQPGNVVTLITSLDFVTSVVLTGPTIGGLDAEDDDAYLGRLRDELALQAPRPILSPDFATMARTIPGVWRAVAIDNYIPANAPNGGTPAAQSNVARAVAVAAQDASGAAVSPVTKAAIVAKLQGEREVNFIVNPIDPVVVEVDIQVDALSTPDADPVATEAAILATLQGFANALLWGRGNPTGETPTWNNETELRINDVMGEVYKTMGVRYVSGVKVALHGGALAAADLDLTDGGVNPVPLAVLVTATINVTAS